MDAPSAANIRLPEPTRLSVAIALTTRDGTLAKDGHIRNLMVGKREDGQTFVQKRPGATTYTTFNGGGNGTTQGLWYYNGFLMGAADNVLSRIVSPTSSGYTTGAGWTAQGAPGWAGRAFFASAVFNGALYVIGGQGPGATVFADVWQTTDGGITWNQLVSAAPWGKRHRQEAVVFNNRLFLLGGIDSGGTYHNDVWVTDDGVNWTLINGNAGWSLRSSMGVCVFNNGIWVLGGASPALSNEVWFSTDGNTWSQVLSAAPWSARGLHGVLNYNGKLWVIGGITTVPADGREVWNTSDGLNWTRTTTTAFNTPLYAFGCTVYNGAMWVVGGFDPVGGLTKSDVWTSTDGITWTQVTAAFGGTSRYGCKLNTYKAPNNLNNPIYPLTMYLSGGINGGGTYLAEIWYSNINGSLNTNFTINGATTPYLAMQALPVNNNKYFAIKDTRGMYVFNANIIVKVTDTNYPPITVPGVVNLDETVYVMSPDGLIGGSAYGDPTTWPSRNFLGADYESDGGVVLLKYQNFIMAVGQYTTQFFQNTGSPSSVTIRPVKNMNSRIGGVFPYAAINIENTVIWVGRTEGLPKLQIYQMVGNGAKVISTEAIEKIINRWNIASDTVDATNIKGRGHTFYVLRNLTQNLSFAYDFEMQHWAPWSFTSNDTFYPFSNTATDGSNSYVLVTGTKQVATIDDNTFQDIGFTPRCTIVTNPYDANNNLRKRESGFSLIADQVSANVTLEYTKDDYQTWSTPVTRSLLAERVFWGRIGKFRRIAHRIVHNANTDFKAYYLEPELRQGN